MNRYFLEVSYLGSKYAGFQVQINANTIQAEIERALQILFRRNISLTGSSRTDAGVHAFQNYFHFDIDAIISTDIVYNINALLPGDIAVTRLVSVAPGKHCRFDAVARRYAYHIYRAKNPFLEDRAYYYPYKLDISMLREAANILHSYTDYRAFSKRRTQVRTYECSIMESEWNVHGPELIYYVKGNRFLRGMVRGLVGTMLHLGRGKMTIREFKEIIEGGSSSRVDFSIPARGLFLLQVIFPDDYFLFNHAQASK